MQLEWNRFLEGVTGFKESQGMLCIFCILLFLILWKKGTFRQPLYISSFVLGICVVFPVTAVVLLKGFTPFYNWLDLQQLFPLALCTALFGTEVFCFLKKIDIPGLSLGKKGKAIISGACIAIVLFAATGFHGFDRKGEAGEQGVPAEIAVVFEKVQDITGGKELVLAADSEKLMYARLFNPEWHPIYGRDLWSAKSASYINSGYDKEYQYYDLLCKEELTAEEYAEFTALINDGQADCIIVPIYWQDDLGEMPDYEMVQLTDFYIGIIKKDLITE